MPTHARPVLVLALLAVLAAVGLWLVLGTGDREAEELRRAGIEEGRREVVSVIEPHLLEDFRPVENPALRAGDQAVVRSAIDTDQARGRADGVWLEGRLVDGAGEVREGIAVRLSLLPAGRERVEPGRVQESPPILISPFLQTDATGRFRTNVEGARNFWGRALTEAEGVALVAEEVTGLKSAGGLIGQVDLALPDAFEVGQDVGDLVLTPPPLVVAGQVVDHLGRPVRDARVLLLGGPRDEPYGFGRHAPSTTGPDGSFRFEGPVPPGPLFLRVTKQGSHQLAGADFRVGTADHRVELVRSAGLVLELAGSTPRRDHATLELRDAWGEVAKRQVIRRTTEFWDLRPGTYDLSITRASRAEPVVVVRGLVAPPDGAIDDPRLEGLDLSAGMETVRLEVVDPDGKPVEGFVVDQLEGGGWLELDLDADHDLELGRLPATIEVVHDGFAPARVALERGQEEARVVLDPGLAVTLELPAGLVLGDWEAQAWTVDVRPLVGAPPHRSQRFVAGQTLWGSGPFSGGSVIDLDPGFPDFDLGDYEGAISSGELDGGPVTFAARLPGPGAFEVVLSGTFRYQGARHEEQLGSWTLVADEDGQTIGLPLGAFDVQDLVDAAYPDEAGR